jgi:hypothetical protein
LTDGEWVWPDGLPHYVERHAVRLPDEFVAGAAARGWTVPPSDPGAGRGKDEWDPSFWLEWAKGLPDVPDDPPPADPQVLERFCLSVRWPEADVPDEQIEGFWEGVWDKVEDAYGRCVVGAADPCIEGISVKHRAAVLAQVLDGLRQYGLTDRVKLIGSEPDPADWQRDRDVAISPPSAAAESAAAPDPRGA